jgi:diguanylate cyclase (GGDEF)-like protein
MNENPFHKRMSSVRQQMGGNLNEADALELIKRGGQPPGKNPYAASLQNMQQNTLTDDQIDRRAFFDEVTPTYNFRYMLRSFHRELVRARRYKRPLSACIVIIDGLNTVTHQYGTFALEQCIMAASETLINSVRPDVDMVGRYGDDRFMLLLPETPGTGASVLCERIRKKFLSLEIAFQWYKIALTTSIGISYYPGHGGGVEELIAQADLAAEVVQEHGGNGIAYAPESPDPESGTESWG